jgi:crotonobetainyl-CoA:carnitine CoA-transferase CaiB-like acyl-CoA transferase
VVEFAEGIAGPTCGMLLRELGARVLKVEPPGGDWSRTTGPPWAGGESPMFLAINRGKESVALDLRDEQGSEALRRLMGRADVVIQGYRPGVAERYGVGPDLTHRHDRLVYCSISGYGGRGPLRERPGSDTILQAYAGLMSLTGEADGSPLRVGTPIADTSAGAYAALGVLALLLQREHSGRGGTVDTSLLESLLHLQAITYATFAAGATPRRLGTRSGISAVPAEAFATLDGYLMVSCHGERQWRRLCGALGREEWEAAPGMATNEERVVNHDAVVDALGEVLATRTSADWMAAFERDGVNAGPIQTFDDLRSNAQVQALELLRTAVGERYEPYGYVAPPLAFDGAAHTTDADPPRPGEHTAAVLAELGITPA